MKKTLFYVLLFLVVFGSIGYAAETKWTLINETKDAAVYADLDSIASATLNTKDIKRVNVKLVAKPLNNYRLNLVYVSPDTKNWTIVHEERYDSKGKLIDTKEYPTTGQWNTYGDPLWKPVLDKALEGH